MMAVMRCEFINTADTVWLVAALLIKQVFLPHFEEIGRDWEKEHK